MEMRRCSICGARMMEGYVYSGGAGYYCCDECLSKDFTKEEWQEECESDDQSYYTEWYDEEYDDEEMDAYEKEQENR